MTCLSCTNLPIGLLHELLRLDEASGRLYWRHRDVKHFKATARRTQAQAAVLWNARYAGKEALTALHSEGYRRGKILGSFFFAHRVIYAMVHGDWPRLYVDHLSGVGTDNHFKNLRDVSKRENQRNAAISIANTSGVLGVYWSRKSGKWVAQISSNGKQIFLGQFENINDAAAARKAADVSHGFHANHGRAANRRRA